MRGHPKYMKGGIRLPMNHSLLVQILKSSQDLRDVK